MTETHKKIIWIIWFAILPIYIYFFIDRGLPIIQEQFGAFISLSVLMIIVSLFPIRFRHTNIVPLHGFALAVFLQLGLILEILIMQLSVFTSLSSLRLPKKERYRFPLNSLIFMAVSVAAASIFYWLGGTTGSITADTFPRLTLPIFVYAFTYFFLNNYLIYLLRKYMQKVKGVRFFDEAVAWEALSTAIFIPISITIVLLYQEIGILAIILIGIPLVCISMLLKLYNNNEMTTRDLKKITTFGYQINDTFSEEEIYKLFNQTILNIFPAAGGYLYDTADGKLKIRKVFHSNNQSSLLLQEGDGISKETYIDGEAKLYKKKKQWKDKDPDHLFNRAHSIVSVPYIRSHKVVGVITLFSNNKKAFEKSHLMLLEIMVNYFVVAVANARNYQKTKDENERCGLTKLYNYRYFETLLMSKYGKPKPTDQYAIILIDLDYFKRINDSFGHQSGNDVLCQVAKLLSTTVNDNGTVARYGGEEFVVLIEGANTKYVEEIAERLRREIESYLFVVSEDIKGSRENKTVRITASIGVAQKVEDRELPMSVLRNADRAMYTGAKQKGRNKVSHF